MSRLTCKDCGERYDSKGSPHADVCDGSREDLISARDEALARVAQLEDAFISDLGSYRRCLYCCERWEANAMANHHSHCVLSGRKGVANEL